MIDFPKDSKSPVCKLAALAAPIAPVVLKISISCSIKVATVFANISERNKLSFPALITLASIPSDFKISIP